MLFQSFFKHFWNFQNFHQIWALPTLTLYRNTLKIQITPQIILGKYDFSISHSNGFIFLKLLEKTGTENYKDSSNRILKILDMYPPENMNGFLVVWD